MARHSQRTRPTIRSLSLAAVALVALAVTLVLLRPLVAGSREHAAPVTVTRTPPVTSTATPPTSAASPTRSPDERNALQTLRDWAGPAFVVYADDTLYDALRLSCRPPTDVQTLVDVGFPYLDATKILAVARQDLCPEDFPDVAGGP